ESGFPGVELQPTLADLDGDGVLDLVLWFPVTVEVANAGWFNRGCQLRAFSGKDGKLLWKGPSFAETTAQAPSAMFGLPVAAILQTTTGPEIVAATYGEDEHARGGQRSYCEVVILNGKDGEVQWRWRGDDALNLSGSQWYDGAPKLVHLATGPAACVSIH